MGWREALLRRPAVRPPVSPPESRILRVLSKTQGTQLANVTVTNTITVPQNELWVLRNLVGRALPGGVQQAFTNRVFIFPPAGAAADGATLNQSTAANSVEQSGALASEVLALQWDGELYLLPGYTIQNTGTFSAAGVANTVQTSILGLVLTPEFWPVSRAG